MRSNMTYPVRNKVERVLPAEYRDLKVMFDAVVFASLAAAVFTFAVPGNKSDVVPDNKPEAPKVEPMAKTSAIPAPTQK